MSDPNDIDDSDDGAEPYRVTGPASVWLSKTARQLASMHKMSEAQMARHLLKMHQLKQAGLVQKDDGD